ncbi:substrate-binding domain-containing protein [Roseofilum casamattae]|uniref:Substrate-binding domain-containing protein n=1 Tax=Roseofilum casamattae BLCC-M143 TaxID=3022442 RepID=A0ABT7C182_9CYAN|nr:substrate-binding domain-containing protein [Roseofilum casamattae]MDJ1185203.1 substrate-binding domain-containing protein [Roseofilum casamattae BLCC-M143]
MFSPRSRGAYLFAVIGWLGIPIIITSCRPGSQDLPMSAARECNDIGILLPATGQESGRWEEKDYPKMEREIIDSIPEVTIRHFNANSNSVKQLEQAKLALAQGSCILVVVPVDSTEASKIVDAAEEKGVPVIAYDRFIENNNLSFYITFDSEEVGAAQAEYAIAEIKKGTAGQYQLGNEVNLVLINGDPKDGNTERIERGWLTTLEKEINTDKELQINFVFPRIDETKGTAEGDRILEFIPEDSEQYFMNRWSGDEAAKTVQELLNQNQNIQVILVANDGMAHSIIPKIGKDKQGKILITGQDGSFLTAVYIVQGYQAMTLYKPIDDIANETVRVIRALRNGYSLDSIANSETPNNDVAIQSLLLDPIPVTIDTLEQTLIKDGLFTLETLCQTVTSDPNGFCP